MAAAPSFAATPKIGSATLVATGDASRTSPATVSTILTAGTLGTRISRIMVVGAGASSTAGMVRLWLHDGTNYRLFYEMPVTAATPSATVQGFSATLSDQTTVDILPIVLPPGMSLRASTHNGEAFNVIAHGADL